MHDRRSPRCTNSLCGSPYGPGSPSMYLHTPGPPNAHTTHTHGPPRKVTGPIRDTTPPPPTPGSIQSPPPHVDNQWPSSEYDPARTTPHHGGSGTCAARRPYQWPVRISIRPSGWAWPIQVIGLAHPSDWPYQALPVTPSQRLRPSASLTLWTHVLVDRPISVSCSGRARRPQCPRAKMPVRVWPESRSVTVTAMPRPTRINERRSWKAGDMGRYGERPHLRCQGRRGSRPPCGAARP